MNREQEIKNLRIAKIERLKKAGMEAYPDPGSVKQDLTLAEVKEQFAELEKKGEEKSIVGRIMIKRGAGKISFAKIFDGTGEFQVVLKIDKLEKEKMKIFEKLFDIGDFAEFSGTFFTTERGQESLLVNDFRMLTKSLLPLPEKYHGLQEVEEKYRKRYLDVLTDQNAFERFKIRAKIISEIRRILDEEGFLEIETPILQNQASGAMAETFNTHHNDYDLDAVLRISLEAEHKMVMAGGYPAVYEIGRNFRNEGSDPTHMQEFTMIE
jgi:lysyl-tRNA synthetase class 2